MFLPQCERPCFSPIHNNRQNYSSVYFNLHLQNINPLLMTSVGTAMQRTDTQPFWSDTKIKMSPVIAAQTVLDAILGVAVDQGAAPQRLEF